MSTARVPSIVVLAASSAWLLAHTRRPQATISQYSNMSDPGSMPAQGHHPLSAPGIAGQQFMPAFPGSAAAQAAPLLVGQRQPLPKQLTAAIKSCTSLERLAQLFAAHQAVLNPIHIAAMITKLPKLDASVHNAALAQGTDLPWILSTASAQQVQLRQLLQQLLLQLKVQGCGEYSPRGVANIVWALAKLQCSPDPELRCMLLDKFCSQLPTAVPQDISNVLWGVAKLTKERTAVVTNIANAGALASAPAVLQPLGLSATAAAAAARGGSLSSPSSGSSPGLASSAISAQSWGLLGPGSLGSGTYDAAAAASLSVPLLAQDQVRLLLQHLSQQLHTASVQTISNSLWAVVVLQQEHQWCMCNCLEEVQMLLSAFCKQPYQALPGHIQPVIRCMAQMATTCSNHAGDSWIKWQPLLLQQLLEYLCSQREHMEMHHVTSVLRDVAQVVCLHLLLAKQVRDQQQQRRQQLLGVAGTASGDACIPSGFGDSNSNHAVLLPAGSGNSTSLNTISVEAEAEEVLARLAASGGPQDASSTVVALAMLQPQLEQLGLQQGVAGLCSMLPPAALPHLGAEVGQRLLAATSSAAAGQQDRSAAAAAAAGHLQAVLSAEQAGHMLPAVIAAPVAAAPSSASNSSGSNVITGSGGSGNCGSEGNRGNGNGNAAPAALDAVAAASSAAAAGLLSRTVSAVAAAGEDVAPCAPLVIVPGGGNSSESLGSVVFGSANLLPALQQQQQQQEEEQGSCGVLQGCVQVDCCTTHGCTTEDHPVGVRRDDTQLQQQQQQAATSSSPSSSSSVLGGASSSNPGSQQVSSLEQQQQQQQSVAATTSSISTSAVTQQLGLTAGGTASDDLGAGADSKEEAAARQLTHNIANAESVYQLTEIFTAHSSVMDMIHITACITRLSKVLGSAPASTSQAAAAALLPLLGGKLLQVLPHANARGIANVLWGYGRLRNLPQSDLLPELLKAFLQQLPNAACRDSAVVLWSLARLTEGQGMAAVGVTPPLLYQLGRAVLDQLAAAATAAMDNPSMYQQQLQQAGAAPPGMPTLQGSSSSKVDPTAVSASEVSAAPSSRDISNSLMALTRLGFVPEVPGGAAAAAPAVPPPPPPPLASPAVPDQAAAAAASAAASLQGLSLQGGGLPGSDAAASSPAGERSSAKTAPAGSQQQQQQPVEGSYEGPQQLQVQLTLPVKPIHVVIQFLLHHAQTSKTLDLQEAATALKQLGLQDLHAAVATAMCSTHGAGHPGHSSTHHGGPGTHGGSTSPGMQYVHHMAGGSASGVAMMSGLPMHSSRGGLMYGSGHASGRGGTGSMGVYSSASGAVLARSHHGHQPRPPPGQPAPPHTPAVSIPASINLSGTQLAGLLQQQRRQQPLQMSGPAYGAGWLATSSPQANAPQLQPASRPGGAACVPSPAGGSNILGQQQQQQQYHVYVPTSAGSSGGGSPAVRRLSGQQMMPFAGHDSGPDSQAGPGMYQGGYVAAPMPDYTHAGGYQQQQVQYQERKPASMMAAPQHQPQAQQQWQQPQPPAPPVPRRLSGMQQADMQVVVATGGQPGSMQYMMMPQQGQQQQQQQQPLQQQQGGYLLQQPGQQQQQSDLLTMQQLLQQQGSQAQQQPAGAAGQAMVMVPASMAIAAGIMNLAQPVTSMASQQQQGLAGSGMMLNPGSEPWMPSAAVMGSGQQQQQQAQQPSQQLMQMLPQVQQAATAGGGGGSLGAQYLPAAAGAAGMQYQVSTAMLMTAEYVQSDIGAPAQLVGGGNFSALTMDPAQQQQVQPMYNFVPSSGQFQQQQQPRPGLDPPGLFMQQQQQQQLDPMQQQQQQLPVMYGMTQQGVPGQQPQGTIMIDPTTGYAFTGGQFQ